MVLAILAMSSLWAYGGDLGIESIDYAKVKKLIPAGWIIKSVTCTDAPEGWIKTKGSIGVTVTFENPTVTKHSQMGGDYHPRYAFTLVPIDWEGRSGLGTLFVDGKIDRKDETNAELQLYPAQFKRSYSNYYYFDLPYKTGSWKHPFNDLATYFDNVGNPPNE